MPKNHGADRPRRPRSPYVWGRSHHQQGRLPIRDPDEPTFECGHCRYVYVSYDPPSERACPICGHSEV